MQDDRAGHLSESSQRDMAAMIRPIVLALTVMVSGGVLGCAPALAPLPPSAPLAAPAPPSTRPSAAPTTVPVAATVHGPSRIPSTSWSVVADTRIRVRDTSGRRASGIPEEDQRIETRARVSLELQRAPTGALRGAGQIDSFAVHSTPAASTTSTTAPVQTSLSTSATGLTLPLLIIDALLDSATVRVVTRIPLVNECDRPEVSATALVRDLLVRVPDGVGVGDAWQDSTVSVLCRSGVAMTVYTVARYRAERIGTTARPDVLVLRRELTTRLEGKNRSAFRSLEVVGSGVARQTIDLSLSQGMVLRLEGTSTLTLQVLETVLPAMPRALAVTQNSTIKAERIRR